MLISFLDFKTPNFSLITKVVCCSLKFVSYFTSAKMSVSAAKLLCLSCGMSQMYNKVSSQRQSLEVLRAIVYSRSELPCLILKYL